MSKLYTAEKAASEVKQLLKDYKEGHCQINFVNLGEDDRILL